MSSCMMSLELSTSFCINTSVGCFANNLCTIWKGRLNLVEHTLANFDSVNDLKDLIDTFNRKCSSIVRLSTRSGIEATLI